MIRDIMLRLRSRSRGRRYDLINRLFRLEGSSDYILDLGGDRASFFAAWFPERSRVILVDINPDAVQQAKHVYPALRAIVADGGRLPFADQSIGMIVCNSVIEHVDDPNALAREIRRISRSFFLQTPNGDFPLETHSLIAIPFYNWLPSVRLQRWACRLFCANYDYVSSVRYVPEHRLRVLFPDATLAYERVFGLKKSFYVYRVAGASR